MEKNIQKERIKFMKRQIRRGVFETNSSSTHSLTMCSEEEFEKWKNGEILFDRWGSEDFVSPKTMTDLQKNDAKEYYESTRDDFQKEWDNLSETAKESYYTKYAKENGLIDEDAQTYEQYMRNNDLETFVTRYTSKSGDKIVAFGEYGYDG